MKFRGPLNRTASAANDLLITWCVGLGVDVEYHRLDENPDRLIAIIDDAHSVSAGVSIVKLDDDAGL